MITPDPILRRRPHLLNDVIQGGEELPLDLRSAELIQWVDRPDVTTGRREFGIDAGRSAALSENINSYSRSDRPNGTVCSRRMLMGALYQTWSLRDHRPTESDLRMSRPMASGRTGMEAWAWSC